MKTSSKNHISIFWALTNRYWHQFQYFSISLFLLLLSTIPLWNNPEIHMNFYLFVLYFGSLYYTQILSLESIFVLGLFQDAIYGYPLGMSGLRYLCLHGILLTQTRYLSQTEMPLSWIGFSIFCFLDSLLHWIVLSYITDLLPTYSYTLPSTLLTICSYPLGLRALYWISKKVG